MSVTENVAPAPADRRQSDRMTLASVVPTLIGRGAGHLVDISLHGTRIRHTTTVRRGSTVRVSFEWDGARFSAPAEILASHVIAFAASGHGTIYETRLRFAEMPQQSLDILSRVIATLTNRDLRNWVDNLHGYIDAPANKTALPFHAGYVRYRLAGSRWMKKWTLSTEQPEDGFLLPTTVSAGEIESLCGTFLQLDADGRHLLRLTAAAVIEQSLARVA